MPSNSFAICTYVIADSKGLYPLQNLHLNIGDRKRVVFVHNEDTAILDLPKLDSQTTGEYSLQVLWGMNCC
jgi:hypothetical protein